MRPLGMTLLIIVLACILCSTSNAENWKKYFTNRAHIEFFYDQDSIVFPNKDIVLVWAKSAPLETADFKPWMEWLELREIDCTRRRYKTLQGRVLYKDKPMEQLKESSWVYLEPGELYDAFYRTVCQQRKRPSK
jgi:hypothetical protein